VSDAKLDRKSDGHPICMQIGQRIVCGIVLVTGPLHEVDDVVRTCCFVIKEMEKRSGF
jgi:hypothetical protein